MPGYQSCRLPALAARMLAVETLLADPEALGDDVLESCLYLFRERLRTSAGRLDDTTARHDRLVGRIQTLAD